MAESVFLYRSRAPFERQPRTDDYELMTKLEKKNVSKGG